MALVPMNIVDECKRNSNLKKEDVQLLQEWASKQHHLPKIDELDLIIMLHSCYYSLESTKKAIDEYFTIRTHCPEFFSFRDPDEKSVRQALDLFLVCTIPDKNPDGYNVIITKLINTDPHLFVHSDTLKVYYMVIDIWVREHPTTDGIIVAIDFTGVTVQHMLKTVLLEVKKNIYYTQEALPFRLKQIHMINIAPMVLPLVEKIFMLMKPFLKKELLEMIHFHSTKLDEFYKIVPLDILPKELGGNLLDYNEYHDKMIAKIFANKDWYQNDEKNNRVNEKLRVGKAKNIGDLFGVEGSFKKLDID